MFSVARRVIGELFAEHVAYELAAEGVTVVTLPETLNIMNFEGWTEQIRRAPPKLLAPRELSSFVDMVLEAGIAYTVERVRAEPNRVAALKQSFRAAFDKRSFVETDGTDFFEWRARVVRSAGAQPACAPTPGDASLAAEIDALSEHERRTRLDWKILGEPTLRDLSPLRRLGALRDLSIADAPMIADLAPLAEIPTLETLSLRGMRSVADSSPLARATSIRRLSVHGIATKDSSFVASLEKLEALDLHGFRIEARAIQRLHALRDLDIVGSELDDWSALARFPALHTLDVEPRRPEHAEALAVLGSLRALSIRAASGALSLGFARGLGALEKLVIEGALEEELVVDLGPLVALRRLTSLELRICRLAGVALLGHITSLRRLSLQFVEGIDDIRFVATLRQLDDLEVSAAIESLVGIEHLPITKLSVMSRELTDIGPVATLTALRDLAVEDAEKLDDLSPLEGLVHLERVEVRTTGVSDLAPLSTLPSLVTVDVSFGPVVDLAPLQRCLRLKHFDAEATSVADVSPLAGLAELEWVDSRSCENIRDIRPLATCPKLLYVETDGCERLEGPGTAEELAEWRAARPPS